LHFRFHVFVALVSEKVCPTEWHVYMLCTAFLRPSHAGFSSNYYERSPLFVDVWQCWPPTCLGFCFTLYSPVFLESFSSGRCDSLYHPPLARSCVLVQPRAQCKIDGGQSRPAPVLGNSLERAVWVQQCLTVVTVLHPSKTRLSVREHGRGTDV
jgi:hypothetical protein